MNAEAFMTPGGIADQLTRGLSGLGQSFNRREELLRQGQRDRVMDDRYTAEMALRQREQDQQDERFTLADQRQSARQALEDRRYNDNRAEMKAAQAEKDSQYRADAPYREFKRAQDGYVDPSQMRVMPDHQDWRVPMSPGESMYGPPPGSPAAQGIAARREAPQRMGFEEQRALLERRKELEAQADKIKADAAAEVNAGKAREAYAKDIYKRRDSARDALSSNSLGMPAELPYDERVWYRDDVDKADVDAWRASHPNYGAAEKDLADIEAKIKALEEGQPVSAQAPAPTGAREALGPPGRRGGWQERGAAGLSGGQTSSLSPYIKRVE